MTILNYRKVSATWDEDEDPREKGFFIRPGRGGKTPWDWLELFAKFAIPLMVALATIGFGLLQLHLANAQHQLGASALDQQQTATLQKYIDNIQDLLLNHNLLKYDPNSGPSDPYYDIATLARARTLTALQGLDPHRKAIVLQFLYEANLIGGFTIGCLQCEQISPIISLGGADLSGAYLDGTNLSGSNLSGANLGGVDLSGANLSGTYLDGANLSDANLSGTYLNCAYFICDDLAYASLRGVNLSGAYLDGAYNLTQQQLDQAFSCQGATLPKGLACHRTPSP
jgi:uncharacterized protein YjbI with pentapeptide repeats